MRVAVVDSGIGGTAIASGIARRWPQVAVRYVGDTAWFPYGTKDPSLVTDRMLSIGRDLEQTWSPDVLVIACNTASTVALSHVRGAVRVPVVGVVPPIKPACRVSRTGVLALIATEASIKRPYVDRLIEEHASGAALVVRVAAQALVGAVESQSHLGGEQGQSVVMSALDRLGEDLEQALRHAQIDPQALDTLALGCTHFSLLAEAIHRAWEERWTWASPRGCPKFVVDSTEGVTRRVGVLLGCEGDPAMPAKDLRVEIGPADIERSFVLTGPLSPQRVDFFSSLGFLPHGS